jgi:uncharacterized DUF497 family protein
VRLAIDDYECNADKRLANLRKHRIDFAVLVDFEWDTALIGFDDDAAYGEERMKAYGFIGSKLHVFVYTERGPKIRAISLRIAEKQEKRRYEQEQLD